MSHLNISQRSIGCGYIMSEDDFGIYDSPWIEIVFYFIATWYNLTILDTETIYSCYWFDFEIGCTTWERIYVCVWNKLDTTIVFGIAIIGWLEYQFYNWFWQIGLCVHFDYIAIDWGFQEITTIFELCGS